MQTIWKRVGAHVAVALMMTTTACASRPLKPLDIDCVEMPKSCAASVELDRAKDRLRQTVLTESGKCGVEGQCSTGIEPNSTGTPREERVLQQFEDSVFSCKKECRVHYCAAGSLPAQCSREMTREECFLKCSGGSDL
jgi:hypothetical protein